MARLFKQIHFPCIYFKWILLAGQARKGSYANPPESHRHFHLMPTYRPFFNDYLPHSLSKWALHPRLLCAHNFIANKKIPPPRPPPPPQPSTTTPLHLPPFFFLLWSQNVFFESAGCVFEHQWSHGCKCLLSLFFKEIKRNNRGMGGDAGGGRWLGWGHHGRKHRESRWQTRMSLAMCVNVKSHHYQVVSYLLQ